MPGFRLDRFSNPGEPFDIRYFNWYSDYPDPAAILNMLLESGTIIPTFNDPSYRARLATAARLTGPARYLAYAQLDADFTRNAAPWIAYGNTSSHELIRSGRLSAEEATSARTAAAAASSPSGLRRQGVTWEVTPRLLDLVSAGGSWPCSGVAARCAFARLRWCGALVRRLRRLRGGCRTRVRVVRGGGADGIVGGVGLTCAWYGGGVGASAAALPCVGCRARRCARARSVRVGSRWWAF